VFVLSCAAEAQLAAQSALLDQCPDELDALLVRWTPTASSADILDVIAGLSRVPVAAQASGCVVGALTAQAFGLDAALRAPCCVSRVRASLSLDALKREVQSFGRVGSEGERPSGAAC
jgi:hypothetical protein